MKNIFCGSEAESMNSQHAVIGILAHVDAGKTTLSESILFLSGRIRSQGRVDHKDAYLDTDQMEKERGITIYSKTAEFTYGERDYTLLDTPGHVDFSPEMERSLQVLDAAILVISAPDGVTGQVRTLWRLLKHYRVPTFLFVNKMDQAGMNAARILGEIRQKLSEQVIDFTGFQNGSLQSEAVTEEIAVCDDDLLEAYLGGKLPQERDIRRLIAEQKLFPLFFGSALRNTGVNELLEGMRIYFPVREYPEEFGARIFKISRDKGTRLSWLKVTGGTLRSKMIVADAGAEKTDSTGMRKVDQIRIYSGSGFTAVSEASAGAVCAVTGLDDSFAGEGIGREKNQETQLIAPVYTRKVIPENGADRGEVLRNLRILEEEEPNLHVRVDEESGEISAEIMGEVEIEILRNSCRERFGMQIEFGPADILYKETIAGPVEGVGHYEPLRHYAEVHLLLEPTGTGSGLTFAAACRTEDLALNWQRLILTHLQERTHRGVLTGSGLTDMRITVIGGRAHEKHTEGGDFRQATYRAVRQGLMQAKNVLLEPVYRYTAEIPAENLGRLLSDIQKMDGTTNIAEGDGTTSVVNGTVPAAEFGNYAADVTAYTHGVGSISVSLAGYYPCRHAETLILKRGYDPEADLSYPADSIFCSHGAGMTVPWQFVRDYMHVDTGWRTTEETEENTDPESGTVTAAFSSDWRREQTNQKRTWQEEEKSRLAGEDELQQIFERTYSGSSWKTPLQNEQNRNVSYATDSYFAQREQEQKERKEAADAAGETAKKRAVRTNGKKDYFLVDGYNIIFSWEELRSLAAVNMDAARDRLIDILSDFHGTRSGTLILIFDAYKVRGGTREVTKYNNIYVVYTKEAETADAYIEKTVHTLTDKGNVTVATSDGLVQMIIFGEGARRMSARELEAEVAASRERIRDVYRL